MFDLIIYLFNAMWTFTAFMLYLVFGGIGLMCIIAILLALITKSEEEVKNKWTIFRIFGK